ncbi:MAG: AsmA-like C-terminal domain-containing protein [Campylobacterota bacterium]|nr:AsmA-like C-terminal domain-containing protein [Campylobacterota bacterium]
MKRAVHATHSTIRNILFFFLAIAITLFVVLKSGISINHLNIASFTVDGLYLKLDKKLILRADNISIPAMKKKEALPDPGELIDQIKEILHYFQTIELKEVNFKNDHYSILYTDQIFYMVNDLFEVAIHGIARAGDELHGIIDLAYLKQYDIRLSGKLVYDYKKDIALLRGNAEYRDIEADFLIKKQKKNLYYAVKSEEFSQLKPLIEQFKIPPEISLWITDRVKAKSYKLVSFKGRGRIDKKGFKHWIEAMKGEALLRDAVIDFKDGVDVVKAEQMKVIFENGNLYFNPLHPHFKERTLEGSSASIVGLSDPKTAVLKLDLKLKTALDTEVHKILEAYAIKLPLLQKSGTIDAKLKIDLQLKAKKVDFSGDFNLSKGDISIGDALLPVVKGEVHVEKGVATLSGFELKNDLYHSGVNGEIDLKAKTANLDLDLHSLHLGGEKKDVFSMKSMKLPLKLDYKNDIFVLLPTLKTEVKVSPKDRSNEIKIADLSLLKKSLKKLPISINGGNLRIVTSDNINYQFDGLIKRNDCFIYEKESLCLTKVPVSGSFSQQDFTLKAFQDRLVYNSSKSLAVLKNLNFDLGKFFETSEKNRKSTLTQKMKVTGVKSVLRYGKSKLVTDRYDLGILPGGDFHFRGNLGQDSVTVTKRRKNLEIKADRVSDKMLHPLINFSGLQKGRYSVAITGEAGKMMKGVITLDGGVMSDFKAYNNVLAFINTIPALATLSSPGFSSKGFKIKHGLIKFTIANSRILTFDSILIEGKSATISGDGVVDLDTKKINVDLAIQAAKKVGKLVGSLPVVGYILTGENKSIMTVGLHIGGTLENPTTKTSPVKDALLLPFRMLERAFATPGRSPW